jgi:hypothetical protein
MGLSETISRKIPDRVQPLQTAQQRVPTFRHLRRQDQYFNRACTFSLKFEAALTGADPLGVLVTAGMDPITSRRVSASPQQPRTSSRLLRCDLFATRTRGAWHLVGLQRTGFRLYGALSDWRCVDCKPECGGEA